MCLCERQLETPLCHRLSSFTVTRHRNRGQVTFGDTRTTYSHTYRKVKSYQWEVTWTFVDWGRDPAETEGKPVKSTQKGLESNPTPSCEAASVKPLPPPHPPGCHCSYCLHSVQTVQRVCANRNLGQIYLTRLHICWFSSGRLRVYSLSIFAVVPHPLSIKKPPPPQNIDLLSTFLI